jgi:photosystem II stability/assembly factor-like uncharacterized protein
MQADSGISWEAMMRQFEISMGMRQRRCAMRHWFMLGWFVLSLALNPVGATSAQETFWQAMSGPTTYPVQALAISPDGVIFAGTDGGGVFRSDDEGATWIPTNQGLTHPYVSSLATDSEGRIFAGTGSLSAGGSGVFRSDDGGETWTAMNTGLRNPHIVRLALDRSRGILYAGTWHLPNNPGGVFRSRDWGRTWTRASSGLKNPYILSLAVAPNGDLYAGTGTLRPLGGFGGGVFRSTDQGETWTEISAGMEDAPVTSLLVTPQGYVLAGTFTGDLYRLLGRSWVRYFRFEATVFALVANAHGHIFAATYGAGVFRSTDGGRTWTEVNVGLDDRYVLSLTVKPDNGRLFAGTAMGNVFRSVASTLVE